MSVGTHYVQLKLTSKGRDLCPVRMKKNNKIYGANFDTNCGKSKSFLVNVYFSCDRFTINCTMFIAPAWPQQKKKEKTIIVLKSKSSLEILHLVGSPVITWVIQNCSILKCIFFHGGTQSPVR